MSLLFALCVLCAESSSLAQPTGIEPALAIAEARAAYRKSPTADRVRLTIRPSGRATFREDFIVRVAPESQEPPRPAGALLQLGDLRIYVSRGSLTAATERNRAAYFAADYESTPPLSPPQPPTPAALAGVLPPLCLPQLALAFNPEDAASTSIADFTAYTTRITFTAASADDKSSLVTIIGQSFPASGNASAVLPAPVALITDVRTGRLRRFETRLAPDGAGGAGAPEGGGGAGDTVLILEFEPIEPGDPATWAIDTAGRSRVAHLSDLRPQPGDVVPERPVPDFTLADLKQQPWDFAAAFAAPAPGIEPPTHLALLFVRDADADSPPPALDAATRALRTLTQRPDSRLTARTVLVLPRAGADTLDRLRAAGAHLGDDLLWSASPETTIDRFFPGATTPALGMVIIRADRTLACAIRPEPEAADEAPIRAQIEACLAPPP